MRGANGIAVGDLRAHREYDHHFRLARASESDPLPAPRTLADVAATIERSASFVGTGHVRGARVTHDGQRKLAVALVDALARTHTAQIRRDGRTSGLLVAYAGGSLVAVAAALALFPDDVFLTFDYNRDATLPVAAHALTAPGVAGRVEHVHGPRPSATACAAKLRRASVLSVTGDGGTFDLATCDYCVAVARALGRRMAFVSDVRRDDAVGPSKESHIVDDMIAQASWTRALAATGACESYSLKFRLPFSVTDDVRRRYWRAIVGASAPPARARATEVPYLAGACVLQAHGRRRTTEMRLFGTCPSDGRAIAATAYDAAAVERWMAPMNSVHRVLTRFAPPAGVDGPARDATLAVASDAAVSARARSVAGREGAFDWTIEAVVLRDAACATGAEYGATCAAFDTVCVRRPTRRASPRARFAPPPHPVVGGSRRAAPDVASVTACLALTVAIVAVASVAPGR